MRYIGFQIAATLTVNRSSETFTLVIADIDGQIVSIADLPPSDFPETSTSEESQVNELTKRVFEPKEARKRAPANAAELSCYAKCVPGSRFAIATVRRRPSCHTGHRPRPRSTPRRAARVRTSRRGRQQNGARSGGDPPDGGSGSDPPGLPGEHSDDVAPQGFSSLTPSQGESP